MDTQIIVVFCLCDDMLKSLHHREDNQRQMSDAEVMTTAIVAMLNFKGNFSLASCYLCEQGYIPNMLLNCVRQKKLQFWAVLMDSWYATKQIMLTIEKYEKIYYCPLKDNRQVDDSNASQPYRRVDALE